jgi:hypothetical protein
MGASWNFKSLFNTILYENEFQNPQIFQQTISPFPEHLTLVDVGDVENRRRRTKKHLPLFLANNCYYYSEQLAYMSIGVLL